MKIPKSHLFHPLFLAGIFSFLYVHPLWSEEEQERVTIVDIRDASDAVLQIADPPMRAAEIEPLVVTSPPGKNFLRESPEKIPDPNQALWEFLSHAYRESNVDLYGDGPFIVVRFPEASYATASTRMPATLRRCLKPLSEAVKKFHATHDLLIEGHADGGREQAHSSANWAIAYRRSDVVRRELLRFSISPESVGVVSRSSGKGQNSQSSEKDRRVEFVFSPKRQTGEKPNILHEQVENRVEQEAPSRQEEEGEELLSLPVIQILDARHP